MTTTNVAEGGTVAGEVSGAPLPNPPGAGPFGAPEVPPAPGIIRHTPSPVVASTAHTFPATADAPPGPTAKADVVWAVEPATGLTNDEASA